MTSCVSNQRNSQALRTRICRNANDLRAFTEARFVQGNYSWPCKGQVSWLDAGLLRLRDRCVGCARDAGQSIAMCTSVKRRFLQRFLDQIGSESLVDGIVGTCYRGVG